MKSVEFWEPELSMKDFYSKSRNTCLMRRRFERTIKFSKFRGKTVLDVGCSWAYIACSLAKKNNFVVGIDSYKRVFKLSKEVAEKEAVGDKIRFLVCDAGKLPFKDSAFGAVVMTEILEHIKDCDPVLQEVRRVSGNRADIIISTPNRQNVFRRFFSSFERYSIKDHVNEMTAHQLEGIIVKNGFRPREIKLVNFNIFPFTEFLIIGCDKMFDLNRKMEFIEKVPGINKLVTDSILIACEK